MTPFPFGLAYASPLCAPLGKGDLCFALPTSSFCLADEVGKAKQRFPFPKRDGMQGKSKQPLFVPSPIPSHLCEASGLLPCSAGLTYSFPPSRFFCLALQSKSKGRRKARGCFYPQRGCLRRERSSLLPIPFCSTGKGWLRQKRDWLRQKRDWRSQKRGGVRQFLKKRSRRGKGLRNPFLLLLPCQRSRQGLLLASFALLCSPLGKARSRQGKAKQRSPLGKGPTSFPCSFCLALQGKAKVPFPQRGPLLCLAYFVGKAQGAGQEGKGKNQQYLLKI